MFFKLVELSATISVWWTFLFLGGIPVVAILLYGLSFFLKRFASELRVFIATGFVLNIPAGILLVFFDRNHPDILFAYIFTFPQITIAGLVLLVVEFKKISLTRFFVSSATSILLFILIYVPQIVEFKYNVTVPKFLGLDYEQYNYLTNRLLRSELSRGGEGFTYEIPKDDFLTKLNLKVVPGGDDSCAILNHNEILCLGFTNENIKANQLRQITEKPVKIYKTEDSMYLLNKENGKLLELVSNIKSFKYINPYNFIINGSLFFLDGTTLKLVTSNIEGDVREVVESGKNIESSNDLTNGIYTTCVYFIRSDTSVYLKGVKIPDADPDTFMVIPNYNDCSHYFFDKKHLWYFNRFTSKSPEKIYTFKVENLSPKERPLKDANSNDEVVLFDGETLKFAGGKLYK